MGIVGTEFAGKAQNFFSKKTLSAIDRSANRMVSFRHAIRQTCKVQKAVAWKIET
jgi:hypothetical protein